MYILGFVFRIGYIKGIENINLDVLYHTAFQSYIKIFL